MHQRPRSPKRRREEPTFLGATTTSGSGVGEAFFCSVGCFFTATFFFAGAAFFFAGGAAFFLAGTAAFFLAGTTFLFFGSGEGDDSGSKEKELSRVALRQRESCAHLCGEHFLLGVGGELELAVGFRVDPVDLFVVEAFL